ncbi:MAG: monovalent cation/H(+) antiporter subunit G [Actinomycetota bacterium]
MSVLDTVSATLLLVGVALNLLGAVGLNRFDDVFARMHAATKSTTLGMVLVLTGAALQMSHLGDAFKLMLVIVPQLITAPVGAHMIARAAYRSGTELSDKTAIDELAEH